MNPLADRAIWLLLGLAVGWLSGWLVFGSRRAKAPASPQPERPAAVPAAPTVDATALPPGHIEEVASSRLIDVSAARAAGFNMKHADDLTIIEGIGPKIEDLLRANGVTTLLQVAQIDARDMVEILDRGGPNFRLANPDTWAEQATFAVENRWKDLKQLQHDLIGGAGPTA